MGKGLRFLVVPLVALLLPAVVLLLLVSVLRINPRVPLRRLHYLAVGRKPPRRTKRPALDRHLPVVSLEMLQSLQAACLPTQLLPRDSQEARSSATPRPQLLLVLHHREVLLASLSRSLDRQHRSQAVYLET